MGRAWRASACNPLRAATDIRPPFVVTPDQVRDDEQESPLATPNPPFAKKKREPLSRPPFRFVWRWISPSGSRAHGPGLPGRRRCARGARPSFKDAGARLGDALAATAKAETKLAQARHRVEAAKRRTDTRGWVVQRRERTRHLIELGGQIGRAACRERVCKYV